MRKNIHLDEENMDRTLNFIKKRILKNERLIEALAESLGVTIEDLEETLNEEITMDGYSDIEINLYTDKLNNLIAGSFIVDGSEKVRFDCVNDVVNMELKIENNTLNILKESNGHMIFTYNESGSQVFKIVFEKYDKEIKMPYIFVIDGNTISGTIEFKNMENDTNSMAADFYFSLNALISNEKLDLTLFGNYKLSKTDVKTLDTTESIKISDISEEEAMGIFSKLGTIMERFGLSEIASSLM